VTRWAATLAVTISVFAAAVTAEGQQARPRATLEVETTEVAVSAGSRAELGLRVSLPPEVHVQANQPDDPLLIPTVLTVDVPQGVSVEAISYPQPTEFKQEGRDRALLVLGPSFEIGVRVQIGDDAPAGLRTVPVVLRYQACNESVCFPPARATAAWTLRVER
jgi:DsbC/DsbD-like thiol-disulfide interchange protein